MRVNAWSNGRGVYGVSVGRVNRDRYFCRAWSGIEVEISGRSSVFALTDGFWRKCPEFRGSRIGDWFRETGIVRWPKGHPPAFELEALGGNRFRLADQVKSCDAEPPRPKALTRTH